MCHIGDYLKYKRIPRDKFPQGIELCKKNIMDFLRDATIIIEEGRLNHAYVSVEFAIEELGKIVMLKEALESSKDDSVLVEDRAFGSHKGKPEKAFTVLDPEFKTIYGGLFDPEIFDPSIFDTATTKVSHRTRLECAFVDYNGDWHFGQPINKNLLIALINHIKEKLPQVQ